MTSPCNTDVVPRYLLERNALEHPDGLMASFEDGTKWTWTDGVTHARSAASVLRSMGVEQGSCVGVFLRNGPEFLRAWLGITFLGAAMVPVNTAFKGSMLEYAIAITRPELVVSAGELARRLGAVVTTPILDVAELTGGAPGDVELARPIETWDTHHFMFTSGTTGRSKAARTSFAQFFQLGSWATVDVGIGEDDVFLIDLPLSHGSALCMAACSFSTRTPIAVRSVPEMNAYFETARDTGATVGFLLSSMVGYLLNKPESPAEHEHRLRVMISAPLPPDPAAFQKRFGIAQIITAYGSSEVPGILAQNDPSTPLVDGSCGRPRKGFEIQLVDEHDMPVPVGETGELVVRADQPWLLTTEYAGDPDRTATAWRNGWFHTGDLMRRDAEGNYYIVDRVKDALRRRGENISTYEVEQELSRVPGVAEVACVAVASPAGDDECKVWVVPQPGTTLDFAAIARELADRMPHFMVPRYYELIDDLPKTTTMKVQKFLLRERGNTEDTWDLETHGRIRVTRDGIREMSI